MDIKNVLTQNINLKANGVSAFPEVDRQLGTFDAEVVGVEQPTTQKYEAQGHYQWVIKTKAVGKDDHGNKVINHWITFSTETPEKAQASTAYFVSLAKQLQRATGTPETDGEMSALEAINAILALKGKALKVTQVSDGKVLRQSYDKK